MGHYDAIRAYVVNLGLRFRRVQKENAASFHNLDTALETKQLGMDGWCRRMLKNTPALENRVREVLCRLGAV